MNYPKLQINIKEFGEEFWRYDVISEADLIKDSDTGDLLLLKTEDTGSLL
jgi:hypothetical protein